MLMDWGIVLQWRSVMLMVKDVFFGYVIWKTTVWWCLWMKISLDMCLKNKTATNRFRTNHQNYVFGWYVFWWCYWITFIWCDVIGCKTFFCFGDVIGVEQVWWLSINLQSNKVIVLGQISLMIIFSSFNYVALLHSTLANVSYALADWSTKWLNKERYPSLWGGFVSVFGQHFGLSMGEAFEQDKMQLKWYFNIIFLWWV